MADDEPRRQAQVLRAMAAHIERSGQALPTDIFGPVERELELVIDHEAVRAAWTEQGDQEAELWAYARGRILG